MKHANYATAICAAAILLTAPSMAATTKLGALSISGAWSRETAVGQTVGGAFMTISNAGTRDDKLIAASSPASSQVQLHTMSMDGGVMRMRQVQGGIAVPAKGKLELRPGSFHIMFIGLKRPLRKGTKVPLTLRFQNAGRVTVQVNVQPAGAMGPMEGSHGGQ